MCLVVIKLNGSVLWIGVIQEEVIGKIGAGEGENTDGIGN